MRMTNCVEDNMDLDWYRVIDKLYTESQEHTRRAETALKADQIRASMAHVTVSNLLLSIADALKAGLNYKGD
jgi:hypothetical protein